MTLQEKVENYTGAFNDVEAFDGWLKAGVRKVYALVPLRLLDRVTSPVSVPESGLDVSTFRLSAIVANGVPLVQIPLSFKTRAADPRSIHYASAKEPVYYIENGKLKVLPAGSALLSVAYVVLYPVVNHTSTELGAYVHEEVELAVVLWVGIHVRMRQLNNFLAEHITALSLPERTQPTAPSAPSLTAGVFSTAAIPETVIEDVALSLPEFPLLAMENVAIDFSVPEPSELTAPSAPDFTSLNITPGLVPPPPEALDLSTVLAALTTAMQQEDVTLAGARMQEVKTRLEAHYGAYESYLRGLSAASDVERAYVEKMVSDYRARVDAFVAEMNGYIAQIRIGLDYYTTRTQVTRMAIDAAVAKFRGEIEGMLGVYRGKVEAYTAQVNAAIQKASLAQARLIELARLEQAESARASQEEAARQVNEYKLNLERYAGEVNSYAVGVQADAQGVIALAQKAKLDFDGMVLGMQQMKAEYVEIVQELSRRTQ